MEELPLGQHRFTTVMAVDEPDQSGACHRYIIDPTVVDKDAPKAVSIRIKFQKGPVKEVGLNGCFMEDLLNIVLHRLHGFQSGPFPCKENEGAIQGVSSALGYLNTRTIGRQRRRVEGTNKP